ncbi:tetratricopeptide repeat protein [Trichlorobacter sp.]|uniref:tetratricopeptide repeat protein n=1 Tax=Trichlorobacter sp. TaxID=2911007 RepID=UPI002A35D490|nr:tetratricopeptide repeat protein [Trichlorobacter sp.]MDY0383909.1 tetratricopeptide repeat protein [Trichlorobacter sp.]
MSKKEKLLAEAQKLLQKGLTDKAIKIYQEALALDPQDQRVRQRLAELLIRVNRLEDARTEFLAVGKALATNGFYLKAIAVYKQIEKLFPDDITITLTLASLNEQHGLVAQAMAEYKKAFEYFERTENMAEAVTVLQSMQKTDPQNVNIRLKLAEVLHQLGRLDEAYQVFTALAGLVAERRDEASFRRLVQRVSQLFPDKGDVARVVLEQQIDEGNGEQAAQLLHSLLKSDPQQLWVWKLLLLAYDRLDNSGKLKATCQHFIKFFPAELAPREQLIRCQLLEQDAEAVVLQLEAAEKSFIAANAAPRLKELYLELEKLLPIDVRVIKGLIRACRACGEHEAADQFAAKISSLASLSGSKRQQPAQQEQPAAAPAAEPEVEFDLPLEMEPEAVPQQPQATVPQPAAPETAEPKVAPSQPANELYEIEIELDLDDDAPAPPASAVQTVSTENWFDTVSDIFDSVDTAPGKVKYGAGLESGDSQSHYDLGMAFREMGLFDEALTEFRQAADDPARRVECLIQQGACLRDKGDFARAESALQSLLAAPGLSLEETSAIKYELALTCEACGRASDAARMYGEIEAANPAFRDVKTRLQQAGDGSDGFDFDEDDLLDFELK